MLIRFKKSFEKIAMGLLSFMPDQKEVKKLQQTIKEYETNEKWHLFLWKEEEDILGAVGIIQEDNDIILQHITVNPSHRGVGIGQNMVKSLKEMYKEPYRILPNKQTERFLSKCDVSNSDSENE
ncbi:GNAT family N-acetyltransferase [Saliterribacillus persicus]|uniref:Riboflavin biosynthesis RibT protein n=1 Tax=Saliterribacillus persicus TaxID=930114 RepID=A0A368XAI7_9BACI|nr:GNAT family N-acetyltransferase [Saliterribacillus persicus]RCW64865.1 riboflavin biosynthesis RibT protein [Saliterribacillus persicus]